MRPRETDRETESQKDTERLVIVINKYEAETKEKKGFVAGGTNTEENSKQM